MEGVEIEARSSPDHRHMVMCAPLGTVTADAGSAPNSNEPQLMQRKCEDAA